MTETKSPWEIAGANRARRLASIKQVADRLGNARGEAALLYRQLPYIEELLFGYESEPSDATSSIADAQDQAFDSIVMRLHAIADANDAKAAEKAAKREAKAKGASKSNTSDMPEG